ncbi:MAG: histidine kinase N-terminal 7TM domain-containing protein [Clostridiaceae bacterium]
MERIPQIFMLVFSVAFIIYCYLGICIIIKDRKKSLNKTFFAMCIAMAVWSAGYAMAVNAPDLPACLLWKRFSFLGCAFLFSIMLHFVLIFVGSRALKRKWIYTLVYLPAAVSAYVFVISDNLSASLFNLVRSTGGWVNIPGNGLWNYLYIFYYLGFTILCVYLLWHWGKNSTEEKDRIIAKAVIYSIFGAFILKTLVDIYPALFYGVIITQMEPLFIIIPVGAFFHCAKLYGLLGVEAVNTDRVILHGESRAWVYKIITVTLLIFGIIDFVVRFTIFKDGLIPSLGIPALLFLTGILIQYVRNSRFSEYNQDSVMLLFISLTIPFVTIQYVEMCSITAWAFPFILILAFVVFSNREALGVLALSIIATQAAVWILAPAAVVNIKAFDYMGRIALFAFAIYLAFFINKIYLFRIKENADQMLAQQLVAETSADFVTADSANIEGKINNMLKRVGGFFRVEKAYLYQFDLKNKTISITHEWSLAGPPLQKNAKQITFIDMLPWAMEKIKNNEIVHIHDVKTLPDEAVEDRQRLSGRGINALVYVPLTESCSVRGFLGFDSSLPEQKWKEDNIKILKTMCNILSEALTKIEAEERQKHMAYYDQLTKLPNRVLFNDRV